MPSTVALVDARSPWDVGGKASGLARLVAAGLPVPAGFVLTADAFTAVVGALDLPTAIEQVGPALAAIAARAADAPVPDDLAADVAAHVGSLAAGSDDGSAAHVGTHAGDGSMRFAVRSSMPIEDGATHAAPGLGATVLDVAPAELWPAIRAVWAAAMTPAVIAYARAIGRGAAATATAPAVIVQVMAPGARATIYTRPPGRPDGDELWIAIHREPPAAVETVRVARDTATPWPAAIALARAAEAAIGATGGADVELIGDPDRDAWGIVQARPLVHPAPRPTRRPPPPILLAPLRSPPRRWTLDVTHNPAPLSVAQAELCTRVEAAAIAPFHLAVVASHLYVAPRDGASPPPIVGDPDAYRAALTTLEAEIATILETPPRSIDEAITRYLAAYERLASALGPLVAAGRAVLPAALVARGRSAIEAARLAPSRPSSIAALLAATARGELTRAALLERIGDASPAWDVAVATFAEAPGRLDDAIARAATRPPPPIDPPIPDELVELAGAIAIARIAADAAERDDLLYWRAQAMVRRALLAAADRAGIDRDDACWLPIAALAAADTTPIDPDVARGRAAAARAAANRAAAWNLPLVVEPTGDVPAANAAAIATTWRGLGVGAIARGPVQHVDGTATVARGAIAVARAVTPALAIALDGAAAIVSEHGTPLDHGAAMARELGIPCVVGIAGIVDALPEGAWIELDGDGGTVTRLG